MNERLRVGITGAGGFIGSHAVRRFASLGHDVHAYQRGAPPGRPPSMGVAVHRFEMPDRIEPADFDGLDVLIHAAVVEYGPRHRDADDVNRRGTSRLIEIARERETRLVFLSTLSAHDRARSHYGRNKLELERLFDPARDAVLRLGLVLGDGGLFGGMVDLIRGASLIPLPDGGRQPIQTLDLEDLLTVLERVAMRRIAGRYELATAEVHTLRELYQAVIDRLGVKRTLVPVPLGLVGFGVAILESLGIPFSINRENVLGLAALRAFDNAGDLERLGIAPRSLRQSVERLLPEPAPG
ncbi:MAG TPA: NAD-dependent epimerase/dehydratase family protein [Candidatus Udaeobacter sp.]|jgi:nucleoside-diphosphate-sugar epimerase|nr:NAD-dependent epimerase/dehydratase family protein [Candidatus Udaeobacter sp.]